MGPTGLQLRVPASSRFLRVVRLFTAGAAAELGFVIDDIEDARVAVDELCAALLRVAADGDVLVIDIALDEDAMDVRGCLEAGGAASERSAIEALDPFAAGLLDLTTETWVLGPSAAFEFGKKASAESATGPG